MRTFSHLGALALLAATLLAPVSGAVADIDPIGQTLGLLDLLEGRRLFERETFGGNGRTCQTCHSNANGTQSLEQIVDLYAEDPTGPLFRGDGSDDGAGNGASRILEEGTIRVTLPLPANVRLADDRGARTVTLHRGIPSTIDTPALDPVLMYDGRAPNLAEQARDAIHGHAAATRSPTQRELGLIAKFEKSYRFYSSDALRRYAAGGKPPPLPLGHTESEKRGRRFFLDVPVSPYSKDGLCAICHSGPLLNTSNGFNPLPPPLGYVPKGERFQSILSAELLPGSDPVRTYIVTNGDGSETAVETSDPGRALITGDFRGFPFGNLAQFKISSLRNVRNTAPYFHNNAARTLEEVMAHYATFFAIASPISFPGTPPIILTPQDQADIIAYLKLL